MKKSILCLALLLLTGCGSSIPDCDSPEVDEVLTQILKKNGATLKENNYITTYAEEGNSKLCKSTAKVEELGQLLEYAIKYEINLMDNGKEFTVEIVEVN